MLNRREFLRWTAQSLALASVGGCIQPPSEKIVPFARQAEYWPPGRPAHYATTLQHGPFGVGVIAETYMGRPIKIEGNPEHPASLGATTAEMQAAIFDLYNYRRARRVSRGGLPKPWQEAADELRAIAERGDSVLIITPLLTSPTEQSVLDRLMQQFPNLEWRQLPPWTSDYSLEATKSAFGEPLIPIYHFERAQTIAAFEADFLSTAGGALRFANDLAAGRRVGPGQPEMSRYFASASYPTTTASLADRLLVAAPSRALEILRALGSRLGVATKTTPLNSDERKFVYELERELKKSGSKSVLAAGSSLAPEAHLLCYKIMEKLGAVGETLDFVPAPWHHPRSSGRPLLAETPAAIAVLDADPAYTLPGFSEKFAKCEFSLSLTLYPDQTAQSTLWDIAESHSLEAWGDLRSFDGTHSLLQPLLEPLFESCSRLEFLLELSRDGRTPLEALRGARSEEEWTAALRLGFFRNSGFAAIAPALNEEVTDVYHQASAAAPVHSDKIASAEFVPVQDPYFSLPERFYNEWLLELPRPFSKLVWGNAAIISESWAEHLSISKGDLLELSAAKSRLLIPAYPLPAVAEGTVVLPLGYGRHLGDQLLGSDAFALWEGGWPKRVSVRRTGEQGRALSTQHHYKMEGRNLARWGTVAEFIDNPQFAKSKYDAAVPSLFEDAPFNEHEWGMSVDLSACIGCGACVAACQAENNTPIVGPSEIELGRDMHWLRVDQYIETSGGDVRLLNQPRPCMHCETAPCEVVCPTAATVHTHDGLNAMVYNRCIGTRYCSNNCPYKVRRFNFHYYAEPSSETEKMRHNPQVTVRSRGVMEKCTYCVQRISSARIEAKKQRRPIADGEVRTACQTVCPTQAIVFGNISDPKSRVYEEKRKPQSYGMLAELGTRPRTTYLARIVNSGSAEDE